MKPPDVSPQRQPRWDKPLALPLLSSPASSPADPPPPGSPASPPRHLLPWVGLGLGWLLVVLWNWRLGTALLLTGGTVLGRYWLTLPESGPTWQALVSWGRRVLGLEWVNTVGLGAAVLLVSYTVLSIWDENPHHWQAVSGIGQGLALGGVLVLLTVDLMQRRQQQQHQDLEGCWEGMRAPSAQKRLLAVRKLQQWIHPHWGDPETRRLAVDMVQLGLEREESAIVREAMLEALQSWRQASF